MCWVAAGVTAGIKGNLVDGKANKYLRDIALEREKEQKRHKKPYNKKKQNNNNNGTHKNPPTTQFRLIQNYYNKSLE